jgi:2-keto-4-pentenoate hydratase/2-oxohepta-3-ene-1,7-dioic acid hydratase in catechol pathway
MRLYRFLFNEQIRVGIEKDGTLADITEITGNDLLNFIQNHESNLKKIKTENLDFDIPISSIKILAPYENPQKIICIGQNYLDHCREQNISPPEKPIIFAKYSSAIIGQNDSIIYPEETEKLDFEGELLVIIGKKGKKIKKENAIGHIFGYSIMNDISARDIQHGEKQWVRGKTLDTFAPFGPCIVTKDEVQNPQDLNIKTTLNEKIMQDSNTKEMIFTIVNLIEFVSRSITLIPGDVISTGTPNGVGTFRNPPIYMKPGDEIKVEIENIGTLINTIVAENIVDNNK